ncbi:hypothetical protein BX600DRAFT_263308 [Xylariales sp. PMI_506]|nr:hypothetical protein BX600DRAFT_263308 [Xylariales sp. PMI_506]
MVSATPRPGHNPAKGRAARKSRRGCRNCKIRRVKCDETHPQCRKCRIYGVVCNYDRLIPDLQPAGEESPMWMSQRRGGTTVKEIPKTPSEYLTLTAAPAFFPLDLRSVDLLNRFRLRTLSTLAPSPAVQRFYETDIIRMAFHYPALMHAILAIAASHERQLGQSYLASRTLEETYHHARCVSLVAEQVQYPVRPEDRDALWSAASFLGIMSSSYFSAADPEEAWPLKPDDEYDLEWLRMNKGKMALWNATNPTRPDSIYAKVSFIYDDFTHNHPTITLQDIPPALARLYGIDELSTADNNFYFAPLQVLARLLRMGKDITPAQSLMFISQFSKAFETLLQDKEPKALLMLAIWYSLLPTSHWWYSARARMEAESISVYLRRFYPKSHSIHALLPINFKEEPPFEQRSASPGITPPSTLAILEKAYEYRK